MRESEGSKGSGAGEVPDIEPGKDKASKGVRNPSAKEIRTPRNPAGKTQGDASSPDTLNVIKRIKEKHARADTVELGIYRSLPDGRYISINPTFARIFGFNSPEEFLGSFADVGSSYVSRDRFEE
jgi:PAS domain-containing protein